MMLEIRNIAKAFGETKVLHDLDIDFEEGKLYTIVGGNGSGKTTLFNLITGHLKLDSGVVLLNKLRIDKSSPVRINKYGITRTFQDLRIITKLTVKENILLSFKDNIGEKVFNAILPPKHFSNKYSKLNNRSEEILQRLHLSRVKHSLAGEISYGQQKLLTIGCCIANDADILLLDEPVAGIDKENYERIFYIIKQLKQEGKTIIQIEHNHAFIESLSDKIVYLINGNASEFDTYSEFKNNPLVQKNYFNYA
jgi:branched-chain amino acid transport system ATP-binding protein